MATSLHYNGTDMIGAAYGCYLEKTDWPLFSDPATDVQTAAQWYGGIGRCGGFGPRQFSCPVVVIGSTRADLLTKIDAIRVLLNPFNGEKTLKFDAFSDRYWYVLLSNSPKFEFMGIAAARTTLEFIAPDSRAYSTSNTSNNHTISATPQTLTVESGPTVVAGTAPADPVWILKSTASVTSLTLNNSTTSESVTWVGTLSSGHWLKFDLPRGVIEKSTDSGANYTNVMSGVSGSFIIPTLKAGVANTVIITGCSSGTLALSYTARYL